MSTSPSKPKPEKHLINIIETTKNHHPNFALLLGAGASITSGIDSAGKMIDKWRDKHFDLYSDKETDKETHFKQFHWYNTPEEYSHLFEILYDQPSQRRECLEDYIDTASPSWGYIYLVNLIKNNVFNVILTTNFDDLLNEACYQFSSDVRPMICAHDSSINSLRITSKRPKIIKLHGDFLFDNIKNTITELETLESNVREKLKQIATEFGLIVLGYNGNDRSIMDSLNTLLKNDANFSHGIYWCVMKGQADELTHKLQSLLRYPRVHIIEIEGFDEFFANLHDKLDIDLLPELSNPYRSLADKLNGLIESTKIPDENTHPVIKSHMSQLGAKLEEMSKRNNIDTSGPIDGTESKASTEKNGNNIPVPFSLLSQIKEREGDTKTAWTYMNFQLKNAPKAHDFINAFKFLRKHDDNDNDKLKQVFNLLKENHGLFMDNPSACNDMALELVHMEEYDEAEYILQIALNSGLSSAHDDATRMNLIQIKRHKDQDISDDDRQYLESIKLTAVPSFKLGALILLEEKEEANKLLDKLKEKGEIDDFTIKSWPIFKLLH